MPENNHPPELEPSPKEAPKIGKVYDKAAGIKGVTRSFQQMGKYMSLGEAYKASTCLNQKGGIDCPGCAWPDPDGKRSSYFEYCENGVKAIAEEAQNKTIGEDFFAKHSIAELGGWSNFALGKAGRLAEPMILRAGDTHYRPIAWEDAFTHIGKELNKLSSPNEAAFYTSGRTSNEAAFLYQLFARSFGTNNLPDCSNMCHESTGVGLSEVIGIGKGTVTLDDLYKSDLIIIMGQNPGTNHPRMLSALEKCKENGGKIIAINPLFETGLKNFINPQRPGKILGGGVDLADLYLPVRINGDVALLKAIMQQLLHAERKDHNVFDWDFIKDKTQGYEAFAEDLLQQDFQQLSEESGIDRAQIKEAATMVKKAKSMIVCWAMGITQHENGSDNVKEIVNFLLLGGNIGRAGAGACPVRGHSNVQGDRTVGIWHKIKKDFGDKLEAHYDIKVPREEGFAVVDAVKAMHAGKAKVFMSMGGNFLAAAPDTHYTAAALRKCSLHVNVSTKLNRTHLVHGKASIILPTLGRTEVDTQVSGEQFVSVEDSVGKVQMSKGVLQARSNQLRSECDIVASVAEATLGADSPVDWSAMRENYDLIRDGIAATIDGFENYNERVRVPNGFYLPNGAREGVFHTDTGKAKFSVISLPKNRPPEGHFVLTTIRSHDQFNTTIYGENDRYRGIYQGRHVLFMHKEDMQAVGFKTKEKVNIINESGGQSRVARSFYVVPYQIPRGCVAAYFPEANVLVPIDSFDPESKVPASKRILVRIEKAS